MSKVSEEEGNEFIYGALGWGGGFKTEMTRGRAVVKPLACWERVYYKFGL